MSLKHDRWLAKVTDIAGKTKDNLLKHIQNEAVEVGVEHHKEELGDLINVTAITYVQLYGQIAYGQMLEKLVRRYKKYNT